MPVAKKPRSTAASAVARPAAASVTMPASKPQETTPPSDLAQADPMFREDRIRLAAYRLSQSREGGASDPVADWLEAEAEIDAEDAR